MLVFGFHFQIQLFHFVNYTALVEDGLEDVLVVAHYLEGLFLGLGMCLVPVSIYIITTTKVVHPNLAQFYIVAMFAIYVQVIARFACTITCIGFFADSYTRQRVSAVLLKPLRDLRRGFDFRKNSTYEVSQITINVQPMDSNGKMLYTGAKQDDYFEQLASQWTSNLEKFRRTSTK
ncbi:unnamed protein product, partial [Mesorhabditis spiculigera]